MLQKKYDVTDMSICEEHMVCEECPCCVNEECKHPYVDITVKVGDAVMPSRLNTDPRFEDSKEYKVLGVWDGLVKVAYDTDDPDWYVEDDFILVK